MTQKVYLKRILIILLLVVGVTQFGCTLSRIFKSHREIRDVSVAYLNGQIGLEEYWERRHFLYFKMNPRSKSDDVIAKIAKHSPHTLGLGVKDSELSNMYASRDQLDQTLTTNRNLYYGRKISLYTRVTKDIEAMKRHSDSLIEGRRQQKFSELMQNDRALNYNTHEYHNIVSDTESMRNYSITLKYDKNGKLDIKQWVRDLVSLYDSWL